MVYRGKNVSYKDFMDLLTCLTLLTACVDYGFLQVFHLESVPGGAGRIKELSELCTHIMCNADFEYYLQKNEEE